MEAENSGKIGRRKNNETTEKNRANSLEKKGK